MIFEEMMKEATKKNYSEMDLLILLTFVWGLSYFVDFSFLFILSFVIGTIVLRYFRIKNKYKG